MAMDFNDYIASLYLNDPDLASDLTQALGAAYDDMMATNPNGLGEKAQSIKVRQAILQLEHDLRPHYDEKSGRRSLLYRIDIKRDIDFRGGDAAFSVAPRLLFRVPAKSAKQDGPIALPALGDNVAPGVAPADITDKTVLVYPNQEGSEDKVEDRPVVQNCAVNEGDFVIIGKVGMGGRQAVWDTVADVMQTPAGENPFAAYDAHGTAEDLAAILQDLRRKGFANQYDTGDAYRRKLGTVPFLPDVDAAAAQVSGFYAKPADKTEASLRFVPGDVLMIGSGQAMETITGGGFALYEDSNGSERFAPLSRAYARLSMIFKHSTDAVTPEREAAPLKFAPDHPLRDFSAPAARFLATIADLNRKHAPQPASQGAPSLVRAFAPG